jgi:hypothetical protein
MSDDSIIFIRKVSSEAGDKLKFFIGNELLGDWSGTTESWRREAFAVTPGMKTFKWVYSKNSSGASGTDKAWLDNIQLPSAMVLTIWAGPDGETCTGQPFQITESYGTDYSTINWTTSGTGTFDDPTIMQPVYTPGEEDGVLGSVTLTLTLTGSGSDEVTDEMLLTFNSGPAAPQTIEGPDYIDIFITSSSEYITSGIEDIFDYAWYLEPAEAGTIEGTNMYAVVTWNAEFLGTAYITVAAIDECGEGEVSQVFEVTVDNTVGLGENSDGSVLTVYPNPGSGNYQVSFSTENSGPVSMKVYNLLGEVVYEENLNSNGFMQKNLNLEDLSDGIYFLKIKGESIYKVKEIVKE